MIYRTLVVDWAMKTHPLHSALRKALKVAGDNQTRFARDIGTSQQLVSYWVNNGRPLPAEYVLAAEQAFGISRHELRPDLYPEPAQADAA